MRRNEPFLKSCREVADALLPVIESKLREDVPYVVVAHSLGNWVAFETLRLARQRGVPMPRIFFSSCMPAPSIADQLKPWRPNRNMTDEELQAECRLWDVNELIFRPDMWQTFSPMMRADFSLFDEYTFEPEGAEPFDFAIHGFFAARDRKVTREMVEGWRDFTTGDFCIDVLQGHHLFVYDHPVRDEWFDIITDVLTSEGF